MSKKAGWGTVVLVVGFLILKGVNVAHRYTQRAEARAAARESAKAGSGARISVTPQKPQPSGNPREDAPKPMEVAEHFIRKQRWGDAMTALDAMRTSHANDARYWISVGIHQERGMQNYQAAEDAYRKAITLDPKSERASDHLASLLNDRGRYPDAMGVYRQLTQVMPKSAHPYQAAARLATRVGNHAQALTLLDNGFRLIEHPAASDYAARGQARAVVNRDADAMADFLAALKLDPRSVPARTGVADLHLKARRFDQAKAAYESLLGDDPQVAHAHLQLGRLAQMQGDLSAARRHWTRATTADARSDAARMARRHIVELDAAQAGITKSR